MLATGIILFLCWSLFANGESINRCHLIENGLVKDISNSASHFMFYNMPKDLSKLKLAETHFTSTFYDCMSMCCKKLHCNAVLRIRNKCHILDCDTYPNLCKLGRKQHSGVLVILKPTTNRTEEGQPQETKVDQVKEENVKEKSHYTRLCIAGIERTCRKNEECVVKNELSKNGVCECQDGYVQDRGGRCVSDSSDKTRNEIKTDDSQYDSRVCENDDDCSSDEECLHGHAGERTMFCFCRHGFARDPEQDGECVRNDIIVQKSTTPFLPVTTSIVTEDHRPVSENQPPIANAGPNQSLSIQVERITLNGSASTDDAKVVSYKWKLLDGPSEVKIMNSSKPVADVIGKFQFGKYTFQLDVKDQHGLSGTSLTSVFFSKSPLIANAGPDLTVQLPARDVQLDGRRSVGTNNQSGEIIEYKWTRKSDSLAAGRIINQSDKKAVLQLVDLVEGDYHWLLTVRDAQGLSASDSVTIHVKAEIHVDYLLEVQLQRQIQNFTELDKLNVIKQMEFILHKSPSFSNSKIKIDRIHRDATTDNVVVIFCVTSPKNQPLNGTYVMQVFKPKLLASKGVLEYNVIYLDTFFCQNDCSGHGYCNQITKTCVCDSPWITNHIRTQLGDGKSNCDIHLNKLIAFMSLGIVGVLIVFISCCAICKRLCGKNSRKHRDTVIYTPLNDLDEVNIMNLETKKRKFKKKIPVVEDLSTDEENTIYRSPQVANGKKELIS